MPQETSPATGASDPVADYQAALQSFSRELRHFHIHWGKPTQVSLSTGAAKDNRFRLHASTLSEVLGGRRVPTYEFLAELIRQLTKRAGERAFRDAWPQWEQRWRKLARAESLAEEHHAMLRATGEARARLEVNDAMSDIADVPPAPAAAVHETPHDMAAEHHEARTLDPEATLRAAKFLMGERQWAQAAQEFDRYTRLTDADWDVHFVRAVAHANTRAGHAADLSALRAYSEAIALLPDNADLDLRARLFAYRGAMAKRMGRYDQAESDLLLARRHATAAYEAGDIAYNLAAVYALTGRREDALTELRELRRHGAIRLVWGHLDDYFKPLRNDPEFHKIVTGEQ
ncbi:tetratricopeptide repeat protein [Streptomyces zaomyceticus]|uniref:tetratricopeptide repeat protein n=1 Tax=Streptomyces zaomyceticus TaxID=68286 RepID=UPI003688D3F1